MKLKIAAPLSAGTPVRAENFFPMFLTLLSTPATLKVHPRLVDSHRQYPIILSLAFAALQALSLI